MMDVTRSLPPACLAATPPVWDLNIIIPCLLTDFLNKCYLCETDINARTIAADHREPKTENRLRKYDWTNLCASCRDCNERRWKKKRAGGWLHPGDRVESRIVQRYELLSQKINFRSSSAHDLPSVNAADELDHIHNDRRPKYSLKAGDLRAAITDQISRTATAMQALKRCLDDPSTLPATLQQAERTFRTLVSRRSPYAMLVRSTIPPKYYSYFD